jgi:hypothetical protein
MLDPSYYARVFGTPEGEQVLDELVRIFGHRAPSTEGGIDAVLKTYVQSGSAKVPDFILRRIAVANHGAPNDDD